MAIRSSMGLYAHRAADGSSAPNEVRSSAPFTHDQLALIIHLPENLQSPFSPAEIDREKRL